MTKMHTQTNLSPGKCQMAFGLKLVFPTGIAQSEFDIIYYPSYMYYVQMILQKHLELRIVHETCCTRSDDD